MAVGQAEVAEALAASEVVVLEAVAPAANGNTSRQLIIGSDFRIYLSIH